MENLNSTKAYLIAKAERLHGVNRLALVGEDREG